MRDIIHLREGFGLEYETSNNNKVFNVIGLNFKGVQILQGWMEIVDFIAILESANRNKLGIGTYRNVGDKIIMWGSKEKNKEFLVNIEIIYIEEKCIFDLVEVQQLTSKLNKLIHMANKLYNGKAFLSL